MSLRIPGDDGDTTRPQPKPVLPTEFFGNGIYVVNAKFRPQEGFCRIEVADDKAPNKLCPTLTVQVHRDHVVATLCALMRPLGGNFDAYAVSMHHSRESSPEYFAPDIEPIVAESAIVGFEDILIHDGCMELSFVNEKRDLEVRFTDDKSIICYAQDEKLGKFHRILHELRIPHNGNIHLLQNVRHEHFTSDQYEEQFGELVRELGATLD